MRTILVSVIALAMLAAAGCNSFTAKGYRVIALCGPGFIIEPVKDVNNVGTTQPATDEEGEDQEADDETTD